MARGCQSHRAPEAVAGQVARPETARLPAWPSRQGPRRGQRPEMRMRRRRRHSTRSSRPLRRTPPWPIFWRRPAGSRRRASRASTPWTPQRSGPPRGRRRPRGCPPRGCRRFSTTFQKKRRRSSSPSSPRPACMTHDGPARSGRFRRTTSSLPPSRGEAPTPAPRRGMPIAPAEPPPADLRPEPRPPRP